MSLTRVFSLLSTLFVYGLALVGLATVLFVIVAYGWDGEPPEISLTAEE